jgi:H+/gluconate symporter-like permease
MSFLPSTNRSGCLAGIYLVNAVVAPLPILYSLTAANFSGPTKRAFAAAVVSGSFSIGNIIGPQTFQARDAPEYRPAKLAVMGTQAGCAAVTIVLFGYYVWENRKRDAKEGKLKESEDKFMEAGAWATTTDKEDKEFRYCY